MNPREGMFSPVVELALIFVFSCPNPESTCYNERTKETGENEQMKTSDGTRLRHN